MQKVGVVEFRLEDEVYCFATEHIEYVFDLEQYDKANGFDASVIGITSYNDNIILLVDTLFLYKGRRLDLKSEKSVIVVKNEEGIRFGMVVDVIEKIEEVETVNLSLDVFDKEMIVNNYKDGERVIHEIHPLPLLKKHGVPLLKQRTKRVNTDKTREKEEKYFLVLKIDERLFAIESLFIAEVVEASGELHEIDSKEPYIKGALSVRESIVFVIGVNEKKNYENLVVIEYDGKKFALNADEIYDIDSVETSECQKLEGELYVESFYNYHGQAVGILDLGFFAKRIHKCHKDFENTQKKFHQQKKEFLVFYMDGRKFSLDMECVRQVVEREELATSKAPVGDDDAVVFITTWNGKAVSVVSLNKHLQLQNQNDNQVIFVESDGTIKAFLVEDIDNIAYIKNQNISQTDEFDAIIDGAVLHEDEVIVKLNEKYIVHSVGQI